MLRNLIYFFKKVWAYKNILYKDQDNDYSYLLILERFKLQRMIKTFKEHHNSKRTSKIDDSKIKWCKICINLINIILEEDSYYRISTITDSFNKQNFIYKPIKYVNTKNSKRFNIETNHLDDNGFDIFFRDTLRQYKALYLYHKIRYNYIYEWWS